MCNKCWNQCTNWSHFKESAQDNDRQLRLENDKEGVCDDDDVIIVEDDEEDMFGVKKEQLGYLDGYSIAPEETEVELATISLKVDDDEPEIQRDEAVITSWEAVVSHRLKCKFCSKTFPSVKALKEHQVFHPNGRPFPCGECDKNFKTKSRLIRHRKGHGIQAFKCRFCNQSFPTSAIMRNHRHRSHPEKKNTFRCRKCGIDFTSKRLRDSHFTIHCDSQI